MSTAPTPRLGTANAAEVYTSVGVALSWWEASEDILMGVFKHLCAKREPTAFEAYVAAGRSTRGSMLKGALERYSGVYLPEEIKVIRDALGALNGLAPVRNQIAHGHVSKQSATHNGVVVMDGNFLVPSLNERGDHIDREIRYALTAAEIDAWRDKVRAVRGTVLDAWTAAQVREQNARQAESLDAQHTRSIAEAIVDGKAPPDRFRFIYNPPPATPDA